MFAIFKQGDVFLLSREGELLYVCCHMRMLCVALAESDWVRGRKGRAAGLDSIPPPKKRIFWVRKCSSEEFVCKTTCRGHTVHEYTYILYAECTSRVKGDIKLYVRV